MKKKVCITVNGKIVGYKFGKIVSNQTILLKNIPRDAVCIDNLGYKYRPTDWGAPTTYKAFDLY